MLPRHREAPVSGATIDYVARAKELQPLVREHALEAERQRHLPEAVAQAMANSGLYLVAGPASIGGGEIHPKDQIRVIEAIAAADGATGWNLMIGIEATGMASAALPPETAAEIFKKRNTIFSGALNAKGRAQRAEGGFVASGQWPFVSGCHNADFFHGQCIVVDEQGESLRREDGSVELCEILVPKAQFEIVDTWHTVGMRGSGSHDVRVQGVFVPETHITHTFYGARHTGTLFRLPPRTRLAYNKTGVATGIARAALDAFVELATAKVPRLSRDTLAERAMAQIALAEAESTLRSARAWVFEVVDELWETAASGGEFTQRQRAMVQLACSFAARASTRAVELVCEAASTSANLEGGVLERCRRDVHVVPQQIMASGQWIEAAGRVLLGQDSRSPLF
jgi:alkylation response protein AidB-like acyl-CoA dehydrogenase